MDNGWVKYVFDGIWVLRVHRKKWYRSINNQDLQFTMIVYLYL